MLPITLPIYAPLPEKPPPITAPANPTPLIAGPPSTSPLHPGNATPGRVTHSAVAAINPSRIASHPHTPRGAHSKPLRLVSAVKNLPLPALPPAPTPVPKGNTGATPTPNGNSSGSLPTFPQDKPGPAAPPYIPPDAPDARPTPKPPRKRRPPRHVRTPRQPTTPRTARSGDGSDATAANPVAADNSGDAARVSVVGTPAVMETGQSVNVTATLVNTGTRAWSTESGQPVRLVYRWTDATTGIRTRWAVRWLRGEVAPGSNSQLALTLDAPPRPGRYRLSYILVRLNSDKFEPPPATTPTARWPGEFGGITYGVTVRPGARPTPLPPER